MSNEIFNDVVKGVDAYKNNEYNVSVSYLLVAVLSIKAKEFILESAHDLKISFTLQEEVMVEFDNYILAIILEDQRRNGTFKLSESSLPTLENILDSNREVQFIDLQN